MTDPALFYSGIVAELYGPLRGSVPDPHPYKRFIKAFGQPALELGCGGGDPMLDLIEAGLDVEGLDSSPDMLTKCRAAAAARGLDPVLHLASMQSMELGRTYKSIFIAGPTFNLVLDDDTARTALERIRAHLARNGAALIPLFIPTSTPETAFGHRREHIDEDGRRMYVSAVDELRDEEARTQTTTLRYELETLTESISEDHRWTLHWHTQDGFRALLDGAGLKTFAILSAAGEPAGPDEDSFVFLVTRNDD